MLNFFFKTFSILYVMNSMWRIMCKCYLVIFVLAILIVYHGNAKTYALHLHHIEFFYVDCVWVGFIFSGRPYFSIGLWIRLGLPYRTLGLSYLDHVHMCGVLINTWEITFAFEWTNVPSYKNVVLSDVYLFIYFPKRWLFEYSRCSFQC